MLGTTSLKCDQSLEEAHWEGVAASQARAASFLEDEKDILNPAPLCALELALAATVVSLARDFSQRWRDLRISTPSYTFSDHLEAWALEKEVGLQFLKCCFQNESSLKAKWIFGDWLTPSPKPLCQESLRDCLPFLKLRRVQRVPGCSSFFLQGYEKWS